MPYIEYTPWKPRQATMVVVHQAEEIIQGYVAQGYDLTLRQLYYQFVARGLLPNEEKQYKRLGNIIDRARLAGMIDWDTIVDRTRRVHRLQTWVDEADIIEDTVNWFRIDRWLRQKHRFEVWVEKEALAGVFRRVCDELHIPLFPCRGYPSSSSVWRGARRLEHHLRLGQEVTILHFGDHDASGIDMTRDHEDRQELFNNGIGAVQVERMALNMDQVEQYDPPPNPAKETDPRAADYRALYGDTSWELDALEPPVLEALVRDRVLRDRDPDDWQAALDEEEESRRKLSLISEHFESAVSYLDDLLADQDREDDLE
jgi:hypothetical protein